MGKKAGAIFIFISGFILMGMIINTQRLYPANNNNKLAFGTGEVIEYRVHYGFINAATAQMIISDDIYNINGSNCLKIDIFGQSVGMFKLMLQIDDNWGTYFDTSRLVPQRFYRILKEGSYRKHEIVDFNQDEHKATVVTYDYKKDKWKDKKTFDIPQASQDMVSGYYYLRTLDLDKLQKGNIITIDGFFDDETYKFKIRYLGRDKLETKLGTYNAHLFAPIMPDNDLFKGENSIKFWLSDDRYKIPLKIRASMFVGAVELDVTSYKPSMR
ncbi:MAG: DUF3108 domain-containing protein [Candidatus Cyclobacteriaceae bacterium M2_1C_046]